jgi:hypothetical protein
MVSSKNNRDRFYIIYFFDWLDIKAVWENAPPEAKNDDGSLKGVKMMPILASKFLSLFFSLSFVLSNLSTYRGTTERAQ